jgi:hypothetical protein
MRLVMERSYAAGSNPPPAKRWGGWRFAQAKRRVGGHFEFANASFPPPPTPPRHSLREWGEGSRPPVGARNGERA